MSIKNCRKCKSKKDTSEFGCDRSKKDGLSTVCLLCRRACDINRSKDPKRKMQMKCAKIKYKKEGKTIESCRRYREKYPNKYSAHKTASYAIKTGKIIKKPCEICGDNIVYAHHDDYLKPLCVRWLCNAHHRLWHRENGEGLNAI